MSTHRNKYNSVTHQAIVSVLEAGGNDSDAARAAGVSMPTFYKWLAKYEELKNDVAIARDTHVKNASAEVIDRLKECEELAIDFVWRLLKGEVKKIKTIYGAGGSNIERIEEEAVLPSDRIIDRFMPKAEGDDINFTLNIGLAEPEPNNE